MCSLFCLSCGDQSIQISAVWGGRVSAAMAQELEGVGMGIVVCWRTKASGSVFTPPLTEAVTWIVMKQHIEVSHDQLAVFRSLLFTSAEEQVQRSMVNNFRVQQDLKGRAVHSSFSPFLKETPSKE